MWGGPSQLDTFDMKPDAPAEIRGEFKPIQTAVPGIQICEHFTKLSKLTDRITILRTLTHDDPAHLSSGHATLTGNPAPVLKSDDAPPSQKDSPHLGSLLTKLRPGIDGLPSFVAMPWKAFHPAAPGGEAPGQHGGWLGPSYSGAMLGGDLNQPDWKPQAFSLPSDMTLDRLESRSHLLKTLESQQSAFDRAAQSGILSHQQIQAFEMLSSPKVKQAFDLSQESAQTRDRYGRNIHGQCVLMARRLVEHGVSLVSVNWHNDGQNFWDTHGNNFSCLKEDLLPEFDRAFSALIEDLASRGLLAQTLLLVTSEMGRKPKIGDPRSGGASGAGRDHWTHCLTDVLAGGGIRGGQTFGSSDRFAEYPANKPVTPADITKTVYHAMGIHNLEAFDNQNRPYNLLEEGTAIGELF